MIGQKISRSITSRIVRTVRERSRIGPQYGPELIANGGFDSDSGWAKGTNWSISAGTANLIMSTETELAQGFVQTSGVNYEVTFTVTVMTTASSIVAKLVGGSVVSGTSRTTAGTFTQVLAAPALLSEFKFAGINGDVGASATLSIDNVSVRRKFY